MYSDGSCGLHESIQGSKFTVMYRYAKGQFYCVHLKSKILRNSENELKCFQ